MITASFNIAKQDVVALACNYYAASASLRASRRKGQLAIILVMLGIGLLLYALGGNLRMASVVPILCAPVVAAMYPGYYRERLRGAAEAFVSESSYEKAFGNYTLILSEDGLRSTSPLGESRFLWAAVRRVNLTSEHLFIFLTGPQGWAIPRSQVSDDVIRELQAFAQSHTGTTEPVAPHEPPPRASV